MIRLSLAVALAGLLFTGCSRFGDAFAQEVPAEQPNPALEASQDQAADEGNENIKTPLIRALIQTVDEAKGESPEVKDSLKKALREADDDLSEVLGGKSKLLIMQANRKPPAPRIGESCRRTVKTKDAGTAKKPAAAEPTDEKPEGTPAPAAPDAKSEAPVVTPEENTPQLPGPARVEGGKGAAPAEQQTPMLDALMKAIDADDVQSPEVKARLKEMLRKADEEMDGALSAKSVEVRAPKKAAPSGPVIRQYHRGGAKVREFRAPAKSEN